MTTGRTFEQEGWFCVFFEHSVGLRIELCFRWPFKQRSFLSPEEKNRTGTDLPNQDPGPRLYRTIFQSIALGPRVNLSEIVRVYKKGAYEINCMKAVGEPHVAWNAQKGRRCRRR